MSVQWLRGLVCFFSLKKRHCGINRINLNNAIHSFQRHPVYKLFSDPFSSVLWMEQWSLLGSVTGKCLEFLFTVFRHFPSLVHSSAASCRKRQAGRHFRRFFEIYPWQVSIWEKTCRGHQRLGSEGLHVEPEQGPSSGWARVYGHVLTVQNSHEECLLKSWRLSHK